MDADASNVMRTEVEWRGIFEIHAKSHQSIARFCREHDIFYKHFLYYRKKYLKKNCQSIAIAKAASAPPVAQQRGFIPIRVEGGYGIRLRFSRGLVLESDALPSAAWLVDVATRWAGCEVSPC